MAQNKKSVLLYCDIIHTVEALSDEEAGKLFKHTLQYVNDMNPVTTDRIVQLAFEPIKQSLKRDLKKWESTKESKRESGALGNLKRWNNDLYLKVIKNDISLENALEEAKKRYSSKKIKDIEIQNEPVIEVVKNESQNLLDYFFTDFPNSSELERISMVLKVPKIQLLQSLQEFRKHASLHYPSMLKFAEHFKNWYLKRSKETVNTNVGKVKKEGR